VMPGQYTAKLTVNGHTYTQPLTVTMDPRVKTPRPELQQQFSLSDQLYQQAITINHDVAEADSAESQLTRLKTAAQSPQVQQAIGAFSEKLIALKGAAGRGRRGGAAQIETLTAQRNALAGVMALLQAADVAPTAAMVKAAQQIEQSEPQLHQRWQSLKSQDLAALNQQLSGAGLSPVKLE